MFLCLGILTRTEVYSRIRQVICQYRKVAVFKGCREGRSLVCRCVPASKEACGLDFFLSGVRLGYVCLKHMARQRLLSHLTKELWKNVFSEVRLRAVF